MNKKYFLVTAFLFITLIKMKGQLILSSTPLVSKYDVTFNFDFEHNHLIVKPIINGVVRKFMFDTGSPCAMSNNIFKDINCPILFYYPVIDAYGNVDSVGFANIESTELNGLIFKNTSFMTSFPNYFECFNWDGIIGNNLISKSIVELSFKDKIIRFTDTIDNINLKGYIQFDMRLDYYSIPYIRAKLNNLLIDEVIFDTGGGEFYTMSDTTYKKIIKLISTSNIIHGFGSNGIGFNGNEKPAKQTCFKINSFNIVCQEIKNIYAEFAQVPFSRIGSLFLKYGDVILDYRSSKFYFKKYPKEPVTETFCWNVIPTFSQQKLIIGTVYVSLSQITH